jgi:hypothetical protein
MALNAPATFTTEYETQLEHRFQRTSTKLLATTRVKRGVKGSEVKFKLAGLGTAGPKTAKGEVPNMGAGRSSVTFGLETNYAGDEIEEEDLEQMDHDDRDAAVYSGAAAIGRRVDEMIFAALDATTQAAIAAGASPLALDHVQQAVVRLQQNDVSFDNQVFCVVSPNAFAHLLKFKQFASSEYRGPTDLPFMAMTEWRFWNGVYYMPHAGCPGIGTATAKGFMYHMKAVASGVGHDIRSTITWENRFSHWFVNNRLRSGHKILQDPGVIELTWKDDVPVTYTP